MSSVYFLLLLTESLIGRQKDVGILPELHTRVLVTRYSSSRDEITQFDGIMFIIGQFLQKALSLEYQQQNSCNHATQECHAANIYSKQK